LLEPLFAALVGKEIIFHGADYDLRLMRRVGYAGPTRIFDTMIGARLCGFTEFSLAALINRYFNVQVTKASQKANWARRPLSTQMADYAVNDTRYLHRIAEIIEAELCRLERWDWFEQSCERAIAASAINKERDPDQAWRITGSHELRGRASAVLRALWQWREDEAAHVDKPTFHILHNEQLINAAARFDQAQQVNFDHLQGARRRRFLEAVEKALALPESEWPQIIRKPRPRPHKDDEARFHVLKKKRDGAAADLKLDPSLIAPKSMLENLASNFEETASKMMPWQRAMLDV
jgi:ribonuclease D